MGFYDTHILPPLIDAVMRSDRFTPYRQRTVAGAEGLVLEIGVGSGLNLPFYPERVREVVGLDPQPKLVARAERQRADVVARMLEGSAEAIPLDAGSVDTVVTTWTLCSIPDVSAALREVRRVLKPGGRLLFVEHGLAAEDRVRRRQQRWTPLWKHLAGGCHLDRPIADLIRNAGFELERLETSYLPGPKPLTFTYEGSARPR